MDSMATYMRQVEIWAECYDREAGTMSPEELEALYDDAFFEAMDLEKTLVRPKGETMNEQEGIEALALAGRILVVAIDRLGRRVASIEQLLGIKEDEWEAVEQAEDLAFELGWAEQQQRESQAGQE